jgi:hypothetical protein
MRADIHIHVKQAAEDVQNIQQLLQLMCRACNQFDVISIHNVRNPDSTHHGACTGQLHLYKLMQLLNKQPKTQWTEPTSLLGAPMCRKRLPADPINFHLQECVVEPPFQGLKELALHT